ncbi:MAG TPA: acetate--CoA ligase family protein [Kofleriaceae bacterium]|nr:acetate--CoA ligase family protein [Kofleriaceae bacterium]
MAQARSAHANATEPRVQVIAPAHLGETAIAALRARGIDAREAARHIPGDDVIAWALDAPPTAASAKELAETCAAAAESGRPVCLLAPPPTSKGGARATSERAAALAYLRAHGAVLVHDVDIWLEAVVALVRFGMPRGPQTAIIAPAGSWLEAQALSLVAEAEAAGTRPPIVAGAAGRTSKEEPTDVVLYDPALGAPSANLPGLHIPLIARPELSDGDTALYSARAACGAIDVLGRAAERIAVGLGPAAAKDSATLELNVELRERQLGKLSAGMRVGDHETKTMLSAYGVAITRQGVATTPSAAVKKARAVGYPVELKPWGHDVPTEPAGCPIERGVTSDALVRRAYSAVLAASGKLPAGAQSYDDDPAAATTAMQTGAVIVREPPPLGRDLSVSFVKLSSLGWTVIVDAPGAPQIAAAPAPLRVIDAENLASTIVASRAGDNEPDRRGLANLLRRASHLVVDLDDKLARLELPRVVVGGRGARTVVADAWCQLL